MDAKTRLEATKYIWTAYGIALVALFISGAAANGLEAAHVVLGIAMSIAAFLCSGLVWSWGEVSNVSAVAMMSESEKVKRERIDNVLRDLSSEELYALKQRLTDGTVNDDMLYEQMMLSDDGELISMERRK